MLTGFASANLPSSMAMRFRGEQEGEEHLDLLVLWWVLAGEQELRCGLLRAWSILGGDSGKTVTSNRVVRLD